jgi:hypothetical protein
VTALTWDEEVKRLFETGVDHGVLYPLDPGTGIYSPGVAWNGLTAVNEKPAGAAATPQWADNIKYLNLLSIETFDATVEAWTYPTEFGACDGTAAPSAGIAVGQQKRQTFGLCYRTQVGNAADAEAGVKLHMVYGCLAAPSEKDYATVNDTPAPVQFSWDISTTPVAVTNLRPTSLITIDSTVVDSGSFAALETILYGSIGVDPLLPLPDDVIALFAGSVTSVTTVEPTFNPTGHLLTIPSVTGVIYYMDGDVITSGTHAITVDKVVTAIPASGYVFSALSVDAWHIIYS